jgi:GNAT superfamily N-acetyltransferase
MVAELPSPESAGELLEQVLAPLLDDFQQSFSRGQVLLQHAINFSVDQGRSFIELNVDTGNESGALKLYEKLGFKPNSSWVQYENKKWAEVAKGL